MKNRHNVLQYHLQGNFYPSAYITALTSDFYFLSSFLKFPINHIQYQNCAIQSMINVL